MMPSLCGLSDVVIVYDYFLDAYNTFSSMELDPEKKMERWQKGTNLMMHSKITNYNNRNKTCCLKWQLNLCILTI